MKIKYLLYSTSSVISIHDTIENGVVHASHSVTTNISIKYNIMIKYDSIH